MAKFVLSAFSDEYDPDFDTQLEGAKLNGLTHIEIRNVNGKNISDHTLEEAKGLKAKLDAAGIGISSIGSPIGKINIEDPMEPHIEKLKNVIEIAKILEAKYIRMFSFYMPKDKNPDDYRDEVMKRMRMMLDVAKDSGVTLLHENEKGIYGDTVERCADLMEELKDYDLKAVFDPANFIQCDQETYPYGFGKLKDYTVYMHIKDCIEGGRVVPAGYGIGGIKEILTELKARGYEGFLSLEPHLTNFVGFAALEDSGAEAVDAPALDAKEKFNLAVDSLKKILSEI